MSHCDRQIVEAMGLKFIDVKMQDTATYSQYRRILLAQYPKKAGMGWPTYIICQSSQEDFQILGKITGEQPPQIFECQLEAILTQLV